MAKTTKNPLSIITAKKGTLTREFPVALWDHMGPDKQGWEEQKSDPAELGSTTTQQPSAITPGKIVVTSDNVYELMKAVTMYLGTINETEQDLLSEALFNDEDVKALNIGKQNPDNTGGAGNSQDGGIVKQMADSQKKRANTLAIQKGETPPYPELLPKPEPKQGADSGTTGDQRTPEQILADLTKQNTGGAGDE